MSNFPMPSRPKITLGNVDYIHHAGFNPRIDAFQATGTENVAAAIDDFCTGLSTVGGDGDVAIDIETHGVTPDTRWQITCVTAAFHTPKGMQSVLLNPLREPEHRKLFRRIVDNSRRLVLHNCFSGDTRVITRDGVRRFEDIEGQTVEVWADGQWRKADARCYGTAPVQKVTVRPARYRSNVEHTFEATANHRWVRDNGELVFTEDLREGDVLQASRVDHAIAHDSDAFRHGLIYADGVLCSHQPVAEGVWSFQMRLCGAKARWAYLFDKVTYPHSANGDPIVTGKLPFNPKTLPTGEDSDYIANFIEGWQLFGGNDAGDSRVVSTSSKDAAVWLMSNAASGGWYASGTSTHTAATGYIAGAVSYRVTLTKGEGKKPMAWRVVSVGEPKTPVPVYCVEVPDVERFTLAEGVYTGNSPFDIPVLVAHQLMTLDDVNKVWDTLLYARMLDTISRGGRSLEDLSKKFFIVPDDGVKIQQVFSASGHSSSVKGFASMDINSGTYRDGAMSDTVVTLKLLPILNNMVVARHSRDLGSGMLSFDGAQSLVNDIQRVNQITLRRSARGFRVDNDFPQKFHEETDRAFNDAADELIRAGLEVGRGDKLIEHLETQGALPDDWARTPGGKLSADKKAMKRLESLGHPLARAHLTIAETTKVRNYLDKVVAQAAPTGRVHPTMSVLGAVASGRMSLSDPELQQFPSNARGIILSDDEAGWTSVDWSSIEPVTMGVCAGDTDLLIPFYNGADLYIPVSRAAGLIPDDVSDEDASKHKGRKVSKVVVLAGMYGQGLNSLRAGLIAALGHDVTLDEARDLRDKVQAQMPASFSYMKNIERMARKSQAVVTISGRVLDEDVNYLYRAVNHFCITPDTPILTADLRHVRADSVKVGDELVGFDEHAVTSARLMRVSHVRNVNFVLKPSVEVHTSDGKVTMCSEDHKWLIEDTAGNHVWMNADDLTSEHQLISTALDDARYAGRRVIDSVNSTPHVIKVVPVGVQKLVAIETSTHTFIANGYLSHNCQGSAADILYQATLLADREGLSDYINLWMHDELICDAQVSEEIVRVMQTPPEQLRNWSQIDQIVLRTDSQHMGTSWKSV